MKRALICGSVAFDYIMSVFPPIRQEITLKDNKLDALNMAFVSDSLTVRRGGTAGNIAFGVGFLGGKAILHSVVGRDFTSSYGEILKKLGVDLAVKIYNDFESARAYMISDKNNEQIIIWQPNAFRFIEQLEFDDAIKESIGDIHIANFSPGTAVSTLQSMKKLQNLNPRTKMIFNPGQMVGTYTKDQFIQAIEMATAIIMNDAEWLKIKIFNLSLDELIQKYPDKVFIETLGKKGSKFHTPEGIFQVGIATPRECVEVTGAGDTFSAGLIKGLLDGLSWCDAGKLGAALASLCVEIHGAQEYEAFPVSLAYERAKTVPVSRIEE